MICMGKQNKRFKGLVTYFLIASLLLAMFSGVFAADAVSYTGQGTKSNPYLIETAEQLMGMSQNLSACYKLNNTIDMQGVAYTPVGTYDNPFTGMLTCDSDTDGTPKYAIKNLALHAKTYGTLAEQNAKYATEYNLWASGLFGVTRGATISNIALLDVSVSGGIIACNWQNADYTFNKGLDRSGNGALIGRAQSTKISGCITTGTANPNSNYGMVCVMDDESSMEYCYTTITVNAPKSLWCVASLCGSNEGGTIRNCFSESNITTNAQGAALLSSGGALIENCYATGTVSSAGKLLVSGETTKVVNCSNSPMDIGVTKITDFSKYVPKTGTTPPANNGATNQTVSTRPNSDTQSTASRVDVPQETDTLTAEEFAEKLKVAEEAYFAGNQTLESALETIQLYTDYSLMRTEEMEKIPTADLTLLTELYDGAKLVVLNGLTEKIDALPEPDEITAENADSVLEVGSIFNDLPDDVKSAFSDSRVQKMQACYEKAEAMQNVQIINQKIDAASSVTETILIVVLAVVNAALLAAAVLFTVLLAKRFKRKSVSVKEIYSESGDA